MPDISKANDRMVLDMALIDWLAIYSNMRLALRHPENSGPASQRSKEIATEIGQMLVIAQFMSAEEFAECEQDDCTHTPPTRLS